MEEYQDFTPADTDIERMCGFRKEGLYAECGFGAGGFPPASTIICPPLRLSEFGLNVPPRGVHFIERDGVWHVLDHIGVSSYPNVPDFYTEFENYGTSRRWPTNLDVSLLTHESRQLFVHPKGWITGFEEFAAAYPQFECRRLPQIESHAHSPLHETCSGLWWYDIEPEKEMSQDSDAEELLGVQGAYWRNMPACMYLGVGRKPELPHAHEAAICFSVPISNLSVVKKEGLDRDVNAALNLKNTTVSLTGSNACGDERLQPSGSARQ